jgi:LacI family transcriptional regulator
MNKQVDEVRGTSRATMKDVASKAGVALKTVSRVVNGEPGVTAATASRVRDAITDLGFRRNESARLLRTGQTATLGFIASDWADPDHAAVYRGLEEVARGNGYLLYSGSTDRDPEREEQLALAMCARRVNGLIIIPTPGSHDYLVSEIEAGVAAVFVLRPPTLVRADAVLPDERGGGRMAVAHLIAQGHRRIGFVAGDPTTHRAAELLAGYTDAMTAAGLAADPAWTTLTAGQLPRAPVTAVLCADRTQTEAALHARAIDHDQPAIVGFGDFALADLVSPPVSVLAYDSVLIGRTAGELLIRRLAGEKGAGAWEAEPRTVHVPVTLITRPG